MAGYVRLPACTEEIKVTAVDGKDYTREKSANVEVGDLLLAMQKGCRLSGQIAQYCSLFTTTQFPPRSKVQVGKIFIDQRSSTHKLSHHFENSDEQWHFFYGFKYYPTNLSHRDWRNPTARLFFLHQLHYDIENDFLNIKDSSVDMKLLLELMNKASGFKLHLQNFIFERNQKCRQVMDEILQSREDQVLSYEDDYEYEALVELHKLISTLPDYGRHSYFATYTSPISEDVIVSGGYKGISIQTMSELKSEEIPWEHILEVYYKKSKLVIKSIDGSNQKIKRSFTSDYAKIIWKIILDHHGFFRLDECEDVNLDTMTLRDRKTKFRHFCIVDDTEEIYVIGHKDKCQWGFVQVPSNSASTLESYRVDVQLSLLPKCNEYHYEIRQDSSKVHHIYPVNDKMHQCVKCDIDGQSLVKTNNC